MGECATFRRYSSTAILCVFVELIVALSRPSRKNVLPAKFNDDTDGNVHVRPFESEMSYQSYGKTTAQHEKQCRVVLEIWL